MLNNISLPGDVLIRFRDPVAVTTELGDAGVDLAVSGRVARAFGDLFEAFQGRATIPVGHVVDFLRKHSWTVNDLAGEDDRDLEGLPDSLLSVLRAYIIHGQSYESLIAISLAIAAAAGELTAELVAGALVLGLVARSVEAALGWVPRTRVEQQDEERKAAEVESCPPARGVGAPNEAIVHELARVFSTHEQAKALLIRVGFPTSMIPNFTMPISFWTEVVRAAEDGALPGGLRPLVERAAKLYVDNPVFVAFRCPLREEALERGWPASPMIRLGVFLWHVLNEDTARQLFRAERYRSLLPFAKDNGRGLAPDLEPQNGAGHADLDQEQVIYALSVLHRAGLLDGVFFDSIEQVVTPSAESRSWILSALGRLRAEILVP